MVRAVPDMLSFFLLSCVATRSGTTLLGSILGQHERVTYLNEPRQLWISAFPCYDVWSVLAQARSGQLRLQAHQAHQAHQGQGCVQGKGLSAADPLNTGASDFPSTDLTTGIPKVCAVCLL